MLRFQVLGPVRAWRGDRELCAGPRQQRQVLALLVVRAGRDVAVHEFVTMLWGHHAPASAVNSLHRFIGSLRRLLEPGLPARSGGSLLTGRDGVYRLVVPADSVDLTGFRRLAGEARVSIFTSLKVDRYRAALAMSHGRCADDGTSEFRRYSAFAAIDEEYAVVAREAALAAIAAGRVDAILPAVRRAAERHPFDEVLQARMMLMLAADGRQAEAFALYRRVREFLAAELGVDPGTELQTAYTEILNAVQA
ncbi:AfsR/SARP family transcriptional regulator [Actinoplanes sp. HUAS TT8]|uniref:AfsR/SARP family transcriptional regulator n=1 Tax=Actinoplanes sp. HUAS TT8 TaxID=3447453 RepID=UPI003F51F82F